MIAAAIILSASTGWLWTERTGTRRAAISDRREHAPLAQRDGYASSDTCRACHPAAYASWHDSYHRTMTQWPSEASVLAPFDGRSLKLGGHSYRFARQGDTFLVDKDGVTREVALVTGSHHQQRYWLRGGAGRAVDLLPIDFLLAEGRWVAGESVFLMPPGASEGATDGLWNRNCLTCHSVAPQPQLDDPRGGAATRVAELGIACEACHGPAAAHVARYRDPWKRYAAHLEEEGDGAAEVVNPARLASRDASAICGQCHAVFVFKQPRRWRRDGASYVPGGALGDDRYMVQPGPEGRAPADMPPIPPGYLAQRFWNDGEVRVSGREYSGLVASACYQRGNLSCLHCHSMHAGAPDDQLQPDRLGDASCLPCHAAQARAGTAHTHHSPASEGSRCANCHMPYTTFGLLKAIRTHRISSPSVALNLSTGRPNACNSCHLDRTLAWTAEQLSAWYGAAAVMLSPAERSVAASVLWLLRGDAGQRALAAASMGWPPAQAAAGSTWMPPFLAAVLDDPYSAVRFVAGRSLRTIGGYADLAYDPAASPSAWRRAQADVARRWNNPSSARSSRPELLLTASGGIDSAALTALQRERDDRPVALSE